MRQISNYLSDDLEFIGEGGFAEVYRIIEDNKVIKILKDEYLDNESIKHRFIREYDITKSLSDVDGVIEVFDYCDEDYWYTMELAEMNLYEHLTSNTVDDVNKRNYVKFIVETLSLVHERNIIHRDISPQNVLIINDELKISDFGLGKDLDVFYSHNTIYTNSYGQLAYCAPEQFMKLKEGNQKSDVYSIGKLINFIMGGHPTNKRHYLRSICEKAHSESPIMRYQSASRLFESLIRAFQYQDVENSKELVIETIESGEFDEDVENYLLRLSSTEFCDFVVEYPIVKTIFDDFISLSDQRAEEYMMLIYQNYDESITTYSDNDVFGYIANIVLRANYSFVAKEFAAKILHEVAWSVSRFDYQRKVESLINNGIEPMLEDIISR